MFTIIAIVLLIVVAGWLDARLNWRQATARTQQEEPL